MSNNIRLESDFTDYYDNAFNKDGSLVYKRFLSESLSRGRALAYLSNKGVKTIEVKPVNKFSRFDDKLVVYIDPKLHSGKGKIICSWHEAVLNYSNCLASKFVEGTNGVSIKFLQIGNKRFRITMLNEQDECLHGKVLAIDALETNYSNIALPVFSIDYIVCKNEMIATDFNEVQNLESLGIYRMINSDGVAEQIYKALIHFNKC